MSKWQIVIAAIPVMGLLYVIWDEWLHERRVREYLRSRTWNLTKR